MTAKYKDRHGVEQPGWTEADYWADIERHRKEIDPTSESPRERFHREQGRSQRAAARAHIHRELTGSVHDGSPTTVLLLEVLRELRALKALVGKQPR